MFGKITKKRILENRIKASRETLVMLKELATELRDMKKLNETAKAQDAEVTKLSKELGIEL